MSFGGKYNKPTKTMPNKNIFEKFDRLAKRFHEGDPIGSKPYFLVDVEEGKAIFHQDYEAMVEEIKNEAVKSAIPRNNKGEAYTGNQKEVYEKCFKAGSDYMLRKIVEIIKSRLPNQEDE